MDTKADEPGNVEDPKEFAFKAKSSAGGMVCYNSFNHQNYQNLSEFIARNRHREEKG